MIVSDVGDCMFHMLKLKLPEGCGFEMQTTYASIGWSVGAALGCSLACRPEVCSLAHRQPHSCIDTPAGPLVLLAPI